MPVLDDEGPRRAIGTAGWPGVDRVGPALVDETVTTVGGAPEVGVLVHLPGGPAGGVGLDAVVAPGQLGEVARMGLVLPGGGARGIEGDDVVVVLPAGEAGGVGRRRGAWPGAAVR